jgi:xylose isomerase
MKQAIIISFLGKSQDRFSEYQKPLDTKAKLELLTQIKGIDGVEMVFPYETGDPVQTMQWMKDLNLHWAAVNVNVKKEAQWVPGSLSRPIKEIRQSAVEMIKRSKDFAKMAGAPHVTCCALSDGYDMLFQVDYKAAWHNMIDTIGEAAEYLPEIPLFIEPKYAETRVHCHLDSTSKALLLLKEVGNAHTGVTLDVGHSLQSQENPAQMLSTIYETGFDAYIHTNDNDSKADWDLMGASRHFLNTVELMFWAREYQYDKYFTTDASPRIYNVLDFFNNHAEAMNGVYELAGRLDRKGIRKMMAEENFSDLMKMVNKEVYNL